MKIGYFGTPEHSAKLLSVLINEGFDVLFVATNLDKPTGRGKTLSFSPVKSVAIQNNIPVLQFASIKNADAIEKINSYNPDINIVFAYGYIIPKEIFNKPKLGTINLHGSLLPEFRGASPVQSAILEGNEKTGITIQYITEELDAGDIVSQVSISIDKKENAGSLLEKITSIGIEDILKILRSSNGEKFKAISQDHTKASHCKKIKPEERKLNFSEPAQSLANKIRAFNPGYICYAIFREKRINVYSANVLEDTGQSLQNIPGAIQMIDKKTIAIECGDANFLILESLQPENKKVMSSIDFINGAKPKSGEVFL